MIKVAIKSARPEAEQPHVHGSDAGQRVKRDGIKLFYNITISVLDITFVR